MTCFKDPASPRGHGEFKPLYSRRLSDNCCTRFQLDWPRSECVTSVGHIPEQVSPSSGRISVQFVVILLQCEVCVALMSP